MAFMVRSVVLLFILAAESADRHISYFLWLPWMTHACLWRRSAFSDLFYKYISGNGMKLFDVHHLIAVSRCSVTCSVFASIESVLHTDMLL